MHVHADCHIHAHMYTGLYLQQEFVLQYSLYRFDEVRVKRQRVLQVMLTVLHRETQISMYTAINMVTQFHVCSLNAGMCKQM